jgi:cell wall-associated NlpC family hydrolase
LASHRKSPTEARTAGPRTPALATADLTSVALPSQQAAAVPGPGEHNRPAPQPSQEEVERKLDDFYRRAESAAEGSTAVKERPAKPRRRIDTLLDEVARRAQKSDAVPEIPPGYYDQAQLMRRLAARQRNVVGDPAARRAALRRRQTTVTEPLPAPTSAPASASAPPVPEHDVKAVKAAVQHKLAVARELLARRTAHQATRWAEAVSAAGAVSAEHAVAAAAPATAPHTPATPYPHPSPAPSAPPAPPAPPVAAPPLAVSAPPTSAPPTSSSSYASKAQKALAFARAQLGKPCVWGASGPGSYDCSGLTRAAWKAAGVALPRTAREQAAAGTEVPFSEAQPGDLVVFRDDASHIGLYTGDGLVIHAPRPGRCVCEEPVTEVDGSAVRRVVRPA